MLWYACGGQSIHGGATESTHMPWYVCESQRIHGGLGDGTHVPWYTCGHQKVHGGVSPSSVCPRDLTQEMEPVDKCYLIQGAILFTLIFFR